MCVKCVTRPTAFPPCSTFIQKPLRLTRGIERVAGACGSVLVKYQRAGRVRAVERSLPLALLECNCSSSSCCYLQASLCLVSISRWCVTGDKENGWKIYERGKSSQRSGKSLVNKCSRINSFDGLSTNLCSGNLSDLFPLVLDRRPLQTKRREIIVAH